MHEPLQDHCPRCGAWPLRPWRELSAEEREVVRRLPATADSAQTERTTRSRWCTRCWHEAAREEPRDV